MTIFVGNTTDYLGFLQEIKQLQLGDGLNEEVDEEMDVSDEENDFGGVRKRPKMDTNAIKVS